MMPRLAIPESTAALIRAQAAMLAQLRVRVEELESILGGKDAAAFPLRLRPSARVILGLLLTRPAVTIAAIEVALYGGRSDCDRPRDPPRVIRQQIYYLRRRLAALYTAGGEVIETHRDDSSIAPTFYHLPAAVKAWAQSLIVRRQGRPVT